MNLNNPIQQILTRHGGIRLAILLARWPKGAQPREAILTWPCFGAGLPAILHTTAFNSPRARNRTTPTALRGEGRGAGAIPPSPSRGEGAPSIG